MQMDVIVCTQKGKKKTQKPYMEFIQIHARYFSCVELDNKKIGTRWENGGAEWNKLLLGIRSNPVAIV